MRPFAGRLALLFWFQINDATNQRIFEWQDRYICHYRSLSCFNNNINSNDYWVNKIHFPKSSGDFCAFDARWLSAGCLMSLDKRNLY